MGDGGGKVKTKTNGEKGKREGLKEPEKQRIIGRGTFAQRARWGGLYTAVKVKEGDTRTEGSI